MNCINNSHCATNGIPTESHNQAAGPQATGNPATDPAGLRRLGLITLSDLLVRYGVRLRAAQGLARLDDFPAPMKIPGRRGNFYQADKVDDFFRRRVFNC